MLRQFLPVAPTLRAAVVGFLLAVSGCSDSSPSEPAATRDGIIGGELSPPGLEDAVLLLRATTPDGTERICGASLVAPNLVVTARHCVAYVTEGRFLCMPTGERVEDSPGAGSMGVDLPPENLEFYTNEIPRSQPAALGERVVSTLSDSMCSNDLAFVVLDRALELPILSLRRGRPALEGEAVVAVGYGTNESIDQMLDFETQKRRRRDDLGIAAVGPDSALDVSSTPPRIVIVDGQSACLGDSGGPLLAKETNALVAVHSLIQGDCVSPGSRNWFTHLPPLFAWTERAFEAAGATPTFEPDPPGDPCADGGCAGAGQGGNGGSGGEPGTGGGDSGTGGDDAGSGGAPPDPTTHEPSHAPRRGRDSSCSFGGVPSPPFPALGATAWISLALLVRVRARVSGARRAGRYPVRAVSASESSRA